MGICKSVSLVFVGFFVVVAARLDECGTTMMVSGGRELLWMDGHVSVALRMKANATVRFFLSGTEPRESISHER